MNDVEAVNKLIEKWCEVREWAVKFLCASLKLKNAGDILQPKYKGKYQIPASEWWYSTHGIGVNITKSGNKGGIDFNFDSLEPDAWQLRGFMIKQLNDGALLKKVYRPLLQDNNRFSLAVDKSLKK
jgi:hypothetical protein